MPRLGRIALVAAFAIVMGVIAAASAGADDNSVRISEVHADGDGAGPDRNFVELQFYAPGQSGVGGHYVTTYQSTGAIASTYQIPMDVAAGDSQRTVLIAENGSDSGSDFQPLVLTVPTGPAGGGACYAKDAPNVVPISAIDCVKWGAAATPFEDPSPVGSPALPATGLATGESLQRSLARGCPTLLEAGDDTNDSAADFAIGPPSPRVNRTIPTEQPCPAATAPTAPPAKVKKCKKKKKKHHSAETAKKKRCKKRKKR
jgi:hypothetical protein